MSDAPHTDDSADEVGALESLPPPSIRPRERGRRIIVVGGAKGGVGKTVFATNLALYLATIGRRVVMVDADAVGANAHTMLGVERPRTTGGELSAAVDTAVPGLSLLRAGIDHPASGGTRTLLRSRLFSRLRELEAEYVVVDIGAGTVSTLLDNYLAADLSVYVTLPEPTAIENTYRFVRGAFVRVLHRAAPNKETRVELSAALAEMGGAPSPLDFVRALEASLSPHAPFVRGVMESFAPHFVLNQARVRADLELGDAMRSAAYRRFGINMDYLGHIDLDDTVWSCIRTRRPLLVESPGTKASKSIEKIARRILAIDTGKGRPRTLRNVPHESHHDLLEVDRGATDEEIRRAYKRVKEIYAQDSLACYGLFDPRELSALRVRLDEAYDVLLDPLRRRPYELSVFPREPDPNERAAPDPADAEPMPPAPEITPETEFNGPLLRAVRESQGMDLRDISQRTKIGVVHLKALEDDDFPALPALVYVRGFVSEFAKVLRLDSAQVSRSYIRRYRRHLEERAKLG